MPIPGATSSTEAKLEFNGKKARIGDRETGIWLVPDTHWYKYGDGYVYLLEGTRLKATWEFQEDDNGIVGWVKVLLDFDNIAVPRSEEHPMQPKRRHWGRLILSAVVVAGFLVWFLNL